MSSHILLMWTLDPFITLNLTKICTSKASTIGLFEGLQIPPPSAPWQALGLLKNCTVKLKNRLVPSLTGSIFTKTGTIAPLHLQLPTWRSFKIPPPFYQSSGRPHHGEISPSSHSRNWIYLLIIHLGNHPYFDSSEGFLPIQKTGPKFTFVSTFPVALIVIQSVLL